jgi:hypothetical protein
MVDGAKGGGRRRKLLGENEDEDLEPARKHQKASLQQHNKMKRKK